MPVTYIPYAPIHEGLASVGQALGSVLFPERQRIAALRENPAQMAALAQATRAAGRREGGVQQLSDALGIPLDFIQQNEQAFAPGAEELQQTRFIEMGGPQITADTTVLQMMLNGEISAEALAQGLPALVTRQQATGAEAGTLENLYKSDVITLQFEAGIPQLSVDLDAAKLRAEKAGVEFTDSMRAQFENYFASLDPNDPKDRHLIEMGAMAVANPGMLSHVQFHENMNFEMSMRLAQQRGDPGDMFALYLKYRGALNDAIDRSQDESITANLRDQAVKDINILMNMGAQMQDAGMLPGFDLTSAVHRRGVITGRSRGVDVGVPEELSRPQQILIRLQGGVGSRRDIFSTEGMESGRSLWDDLTPQERQELVNGLGGLGRLGGDMPEEVMNKVKAGQVPSMSDFNFSITSGLSPQLQALLNATGWIASRGGTIR